MGTYDPLLVGFYTSYPCKTGWLALLHAATIYSSLHEGELAVPLKFVVPESTEGNGDGPTSCGAIGWESSFK